MSRVFVVQIPTAWDPETRTRVEKFDLSPAEEYGKVVHVLGPDKLRDDEDPQLVAQRVYDALDGFQDDDYLLPLGDPAVCAMAVIGATSRASGVVQVLKYHRSAGRYFPVRIEY